MGIEEAWALSLLAAEFLLSTLTEVQGIGVHGLAWNPATFIEGGEMAGSPLLLWVPEDTTADMRIRTQS